MYYIVEYGDGVNFTSFYGYTQSEYIARMLMVQSDDIDYYVYQPKHIKSIDDLATMLYTDYDIDTCNCIEDIDFYKLKIMHCQGLFRNFAVIGTDAMIQDIIDTDMMALDILHIMKQSIFNLRLIFGEYSVQFHEYGKFLSYLYIYMAGYSNNSCVILDSFYKGFKLDPIYIYGFLNDALTQINSSIMRKD